MNNIKKIFVDNKEINLNSLFANNGKYNIGYPNTNVKVEILLNDKSYIPAYMFSYCNTLKSAYIPKTIKNIETGAFANTNISYITGLSYDMNLSYGIFYNTYIPQNMLEEQGISYISYLFYDPVTNTTYSYTDINNDNNGDNQDINVGQYTNDTYEIGDVYTLPLVYTERSGQKREQTIGTATVQIIEIDENEPESDQFKLKILVKDAYIDNPLSDSSIDYYNEIVGRKFYVQATFILANIEGYFATIPGFREGIDGVDTFFAMKSEGDTYYPELENFYGVTDYAIRKLTNNLQKDYHEDL